MTETTATTDLQSPERRNLMLAAGVGAAALGVALASPRTALAQPTSEWDKVFPKSDRVNHQKVSFTNRYGMTLVGDLYVPGNRGSAKLPALAVAGPFGAVKEQSSGLVASPDINTEDFMAAVDCLGLRPEVDRDRIGMIGICGFGGMALNAAAPDKRVKAVAVTSMYDMSRVNARGYYDAMTADDRTAALTKLSLKRWEDSAKGGPPALAGGLPETLDGIDNPVINMYWHYYKTDRGYHARSVNSNGGWNVTSAISFMNMPQLTYIREISPRPTLIIAGSEAHSRYFSEDAYKTAAEPKELIIIDGAEHVDLYDQIDIIPFDRLTSFFSENLA